jgi:hypothetical protein
MGADGRLAASETPKPNHADLVSSTSHGRKKLWLGSFASEKVLIFSVFRKGNPKGCTGLLSLVASPPTRFRKPRSQAMWGWTRSPSHGHKKLWLGSYASEKDLILFLFFARAAPNPKAARSCGLTTHAASETPKPSHVGMDEVPFTWSQKAVAW